VSAYDVMRVGSRAVLRPPGDPADLVEGSGWGGYTGDLLDRVTEAALRRGGPGPVRLDVELVPRPDNEYSEHAISVVWPRSTRNGLESCHLAFLPGSYLYRVGNSLLPDLFAALERLHQGPAKIVCTAVVSDVGELALDLPAGAVLGKAIARHLAGLEPGYRPTQQPSWDKRPGWHPPRDDHRHTEGHQDTTLVLSCLQQFAGPRQPIEQLSITTVLPARGGPRMLVLSDPTGHRSVGFVASGHLFLDDERDRDEVLPLLAQAGIAVARPLTQEFAAEDWPAAAVPNIWTYWFTEKLDLRWKDPQQPNGQGWLARYNPTTAVLWVEDSRLVAPARIYAARVGLQVRAVGLPEQPWNLEAEVPQTELRDATIERDRHDLGQEVSFTGSVRRLVPAGLYCDDVQWIKTPNPPALPEDDTVFRMHERFVAARGRLLGAHELTGTLRPCRLCGQLASELTAPICSSPLSYCHACLSVAQAGTGDDASRAAVALGLISELEFGGAPMLEEQLSSLHVDPATPEEPSQIDKMLLLRVALRRRRYAWTHLLEAAGLVKDGYRTSRGTLIRARDGHLCLSMREKAVCDFLHQNDIAHDREPLYPFDPELNRHGRRRADWLLLDGTLVELWGMPNDPAYAAKMIAKRDLARLHKLRLVEITDADLPVLPRVFAEWLPATQGGADLTTWSWSPALPHQDAVPKPLPLPRGDTRGRNDHNTAAREGRLARAQEAVRLQQAGLSRADIAVQLGGASAQLLKSLLRDGKFYADPTTDQVRALLARDAAQARAEGLTRAQFQQARALTGPKAEEAWRDADVLSGPP
jgi:hypothetical protein